MKCEVSIIHNSHWVDCGDKGYHICDGRKMEKIIVTSEAYQCWSVTRGETVLGIARTRREARNIAENHRKVNHT